MTRWIDGLFSAEFKGSFIFFTLALSGIGIWLAIRGLLNGEDQNQNFREAFEHWPIPTKTELRRKIDDGSYRSLEGTLWWIETEWLPFTADCYVHYYENFFGRTFGEFREQTVFMWRLTPEGRLQTLDLMNISPGCSPEDHCGQGWLSFYLTDEESEFSIKVDPNAKWEETMLEFGEYGGRPTILSAEGKHYAYYSVAAGRDG